MCYLPKFPISSCETFLFCISDNTLPSFPVSFEVHGIEPDVCGTYGGCVFTISGAGLANEHSSYNIIIADSVCTIRDDSTDTDLICGVPSFTRTTNVANDGVHSCESTFHAVLD